jgi:hypothetical protein
MWIYKYLKTYDMKIIQDIIPLKEDEKPFQQKLKDASFIRAIGEERIE